MTPNAATVQHKNNAVYLTCDGVTYRLHDALVHAERQQLVSLGSVVANHRFFVTKEGMVRSYAFNHHEVRAIASAALKAQLREVGPCRSSQVAAAHIEEVCVDF